MSTDVLPDEDFEASTSAYRRELHVHCYRMLASYDEAEDAVQETYLRAWRSWESFTREHVRAWLYRIATNVCVDMIRARGRHLSRMRSYAEIGWLTPYPDRLLDHVAAREDEPEVAAVAKETIELAFLAALQVLPPRQRAVLLAREVLGLPAEEMASMLEMSVPAANSALQRARSTMRRHLPSHRNDWSAQPPSPAERELLEAFIDAHERCDAAAVVAIATQDLRITMPPNPEYFDGLDTIHPLLERAFGPDRDGDWRLRPTRANRMPAAASYLRRPGDSEFRGFKLDVLRIEDSLVAEITTFGWSHFERLGLPLILPDT
jgi:RNA polymerase sigma-70 factor (TIGR02960 family)